MTRREKRIAQDILRLARSVLSVEFDPRIVEKYLKEHPDADKFKHMAKKREQRKWSDIEDDIADVMEKEGWRGLFETTNNGVVVYVPRKEVGKNRDDYESNLKFTIGNALKSVSGVRDVKMEPLGMERNKYQYLFTVR